MMQKISEVKEELERLKEKVEDDRSKFAIKVAIVMMSDSRALSFADTERDYI